MKRQFLLYASIVISISLYAGNLTTEQAEVIARQFLTKNNPSVSRRAMKMVKRQPLTLSIAQDATAYYAFNMDGDKGYVIVSGSDLAPRVLAFSEKGSFMEDELPTNMKAWLQGYADQIAYLEHTAGKYEAPRLLTQRNALSPLIKSTWYQNSPYNNKCPVDPSTGNHCATGCVATAMAQVIYYYKYPSQTKAVIPSYTTKTKGISIPEIGITTIDWGNMLDNYNSSATTSQKNAVAQLMLLCGQALGMDYDYPESGINLSNMPLEAMALKRYFGYDQTVRALDRNAFSTLEWETLIYDEIAAGRPVLYNGLSSGGGHAFVIDGYDGEGLFHVNWGWSGDSDGYFTLSILNPYNTTSTGASSSDDGYSIEQSAVVGIQHGTEDVIAERFQVTDIKVTGSTIYTRSSTSEDFTGISIQPTAWNMTGDNHSFVLGLTLMDEKDNWVTSVFNGVNYGSQDFLYGGSYNFEDCSFGSNIPDGVYYIVPVSASENSDIWEPCWRSNVYRVKATINGNSLTLTEPSTNLNGTMQVTSQAVVGEPLSITAQITNNGSYFNDYVYLFEPDEENEPTMVGGRMFEAQEGETANFNIDYVPMVTGSKTLALVCYDMNGKAQIIGHTTATIRKCLDYTVSITNAVNDIVADGKVSAKVNVLNNGNLYNDEVALVLFKYNESANTYYYEADKTQLLTLSSGANTTLSFEFDNLEMEQKYVLSFQYFKANELHDHGGYVFFSTKISELKLSLSANPDGGVISYMQEVKLTASNPSAEIYCTFDGMEPTKNDFLYDPPLQIDHSLTLKAKAFLDGYEDSETLTQEYQVKLDIEADRASGVVKAGQTVSLSCSHPEAIIYYTTDGSTPTKSSKVYKAPITIDNSMVIKAIAIHNDCLSSDILTRNYVVTKVKLNVSHTGGTVSKGTKVTITSTPADAIIFYTMDGSEPTVGSNMYEEPVTIQKNTTLKAIAYAEGYAESDLLTANYSVKLNLQASQVSGTVDYLSEVVLSADDPEATIYYTTDGSTPTQESTVYDSPIVIDETMTVKAIAYHQDYQASDVLTRNYTIQTVMLSVSPDTSELLPAGTEITLTANPADANIYYTTDGSEPTEKSSLYSAPIIAEHSFTLRTKAFYDGYKVSEEICIHYEVTNLIATKCFPEQDESTINKHIIPSITFDGLIQEGQNYADISVQKEGEPVAGEPIIVNNTLYFVPNIELEEGFYVFNIPEKALMCNDSPNITKQHCFSIIPSVLPMAAVGYAHSLAIKGDGSLWAWGKNDYDQLGETITTPYSMVPVKVLDDAIGLAAGDYNCYAIKRDGSLWAWGRNRGYLGNGKTTKTNSTPVKILDDVITVKSSGYHGLAIKKDGTLYAWGDNEYGQIGDKTTTDRYSPVKVLSNVVAIAAGDSYSMAVKEDGTLWTWGNNAEGQLGDGTTTSRITPKQILSDVQTIAAGSQHSLAVKKDGSLWAWGYNSTYGCLGDGTTTRRRTTPVKILDNVVAVDAGQLISYAIKTDRSLWAWGRNDEGTIGDGTRTHRLEPVKILDDVISVSGGSRHCLASKSDNTLWAWGINTYGQIGDSTKTDRSIPVKVVYTSADMIPNKMSLRDSVLVQVGKRTLITPQYEPANADYESMEWNSSREDIATVSPRGIVTGIAPGEATLSVRITTRDGAEFIEDCSVIVTENIIKGDVNGDKRVSISDVSVLRNYLLGNNPEKYDEKAADMNDDGRVSISDVGKLVNQLLNKKE